MKYRFRIDTPFGKRGTIIDDGSMSSFKIAGFQSLSDFPDLFEPIPEADPVEKVAKWLRAVFDRKTGYGLFSSDCAKDLIAAGLDPERLGDV